jgi:hypothetical protein
MSVAPALSPHLFSLCQPGPACQPLPPRPDHAIGAIAAGHRPPRCLAINTLANKVWRLASLSPCACPEPSRHPVSRAIPSPPLCAIIAATTSIAGARHLSSLPPPRSPIKGPPRAPPTPHTGLGLPTPLPRSQSSRAAAPFLRSGECSLPSLVA